MKPQRKQTPFRLKLSKIEMVEAVAKLGSISAASKVLGISQPALTKGIMSVEQGLDIKLFNRTNAGLQPTKFVIPFLKHGSRILLEVENTKSIILKQNKAVEMQRSSGALRIAAGIRSCHLWIDQAVKKLSEHYADLKISVDHDLLYLYRRILRSEIDVGVTMRVLLPSMPSGIKIQTLGIWRAYFVCRPDHPLAKIDSPAISDLQQYPLAGDYNFPVLVRMLESGHFDINNFRPASGWLMSATQVNGLDEMVKLIKSSDHIAILPYEVVSNELAHQELVKLNISEFCDLTLEVVFVYRDEGDLAAPLKSLFDIVKKIEEERHGNKEEAPT